MRSEWRATRKIGGDACTTRGANAGSARAWRGSRRQYDRRMPSTVSSATPQCQPRRALALCGVQLFGLGVVRVVSAIDGVQIESVRIECEGWIAEGIALDVGLPRAGIASHATIARLEPPASAHVHRNVR